MYKSWYQFFGAGRYTYLSVCQQFCLLRAQNSQTIVKLFLSYILYLLMYGSFPKFWKYLSTKKGWIFVIIIISSSIMINILLLLLF